MKPYQLAFLGASALFFTQAASAAFLVGLNDFNGTTTPEAVVVTSGFQATAQKGTASIDNLGSTNTTYGDGTTTVAGNGNVRLNTTSTASFTFKNTNTSSYTLASFLFDAVTTTGSLVNLNYTVLGATGLPVSGPTAQSYTVKPSGTPIAINNVTTTNASSQAYSQHVAALTGITLAQNQSIVFTFTVPSGGGRLDNIGLTGVISAIPEPGSLVALGCLVGSGAFLRTRRRSAVA